MIKKIALTLLVLIFTISVFGQIPIDSLTNNEATQNTVTDDSVTTDPDGDSETTTDASGPETRIVAFVDVSSLLNFRSGPGTNYRKIGTLRPNTELTIIRRQGNWLNVRANNLTGWVSADYVSYRQVTSTTETRIPETPATPPATPEETVSGRVTASALNVRSGPGLSNGKTGLLRNGNSVTILRTQDGWHQIEYGNGQTGWVSARYISTSGASGESTTPPPSSGGTTNGVLNVPIHYQGDRANIINGRDYRWKWCGPTSARMVGEFLGITGKSTHEWADLCRYNYTAYSGTGVDQIRDGLRRAGANAESVWSSNLTALKNSVNSGRPFIALVNTEWRGHYVVVKGFRNGKVIVNDPANGREREFSESYFMTMWGARGRHGISAWR